MSTPMERSASAGGRAVLDGPQATADPAATAGRRGISRRVLVLLGALVAIAVAAGVLVSVSGTDDDPPPYSGATHPWASGISGQGVTDGAVAQWRGRPIDITSTWADNNDAMVALANLQPGAEFGDWDQPLDIAVGAISADESWSDAADGAYDDRWRESLTNLRDLWGDRSATLYIRFAHEMNGNWYPWKVTADDATSFKEAWIRYRALQQEIFPESKLVFSVNRESVDTGIDWRTTFPGKQYVDVMSVDYYNDYPYVGSGHAWYQSLDDVDEWGGPKGLDQHLAFAASVGLPLVVSEWSGNADAGDSPAFIQGMYDFFREHGGTGAGELMYEIQYNQDGDDGRWLLYGDTQMPKSAERYRELFGSS